MSISVSSVSVVPRATERPLPVIGIIATLVDYAGMAAGLAGVGRTLLVDQRSTIAAIRGGRLDLLILSPRNDRWSAAAASADEAAAAGLPVLAMVPRGDAAALGRAFDAGAADCVPYPFDAAESAVRIRALLRRTQVADRLRADAAAVRRLALTDPVTGLWNRHHLDIEFAARVAAAVATGRPLSVLMIDIDRFKPINDRHGHAIGDNVLRAVATRLSGGIRVNDTLARFGGDELVLVMPDTALEAAATVAERLRALVADGTTEVPFGITVSIGVAERGDDEAAAGVLVRADKSLYDAKERGRNRIAVAS